MKQNQIVRILQREPVNQSLEVNGWVRTRRDAGKLSFLEISDGSCLANLQVIAESGLAEYDSVIKKLSVGCAVRITGTLVESPARGQKVELRATKVELLGGADPENYPLQKKRHTFEFLRTIPHLRPRTNALAAVARVRNALNLGIHDFFRERGFFQVHTPIITTSDCEGAGEMFTVTTLEPEQLRAAEPYGLDFFGRRAGLTVSGQLQAEIYALALGRVYTFGPTFRAENSNTTRHLAEFWMLEPEMAFCDLTCNMAVAEELIKYLVETALGQCAPEIELFDRFVSKGLRQRLERTAAEPFVRMSYGEAVERLLKSGCDFEYPVRWGVDLQAEHERYLCEEVVGGALIVSDYPRAIKPFYMRLNEDGETVAAMDILVPGIGELIGGSQREERYEVLEARMDEAGLNHDDYGWYLDLRRYGSAPHSGFGLGFERFVQYVTGMGNIRDVIPFPRTPGSASC